MEDEIIKLLKEISGKLDDVKSECSSINRNTYDIDQVKETVEKIQEKVKCL